VVGIGSEDGWTRPVAAVLENIIVVSHRNLEHAADEIPSELQRVCSVHSLGKCLTAWAVSSTASYNASISGSYSAMIACRRAVNFAVRTNGFLGDETRIICSESSSDEGQCLITHENDDPPKKK
jgi:hypothetical protein